MAIYLELDYNKDEIMDNIQFKVYVDSVENSFKTFENNLTIYF